MTTELTLVLYPLKTLPKLNVRKSAHTPGLTQANAIFFKKRQLRGQIVSNTGIQLEPSLDKFLALLDRELSSGVGFETLRKTARTSVKNGEEVSSLTCLAHHEVFCCFV